MTGTEVDRVLHARRHRAGQLRRRPRARARAAPGRRPADASARSRSARATSRTIVCGAPNVAAGQTVGRRLAGRGDARRHAPEAREAARRRRPTGMILAEDEVAIGIDHDGIMVLDDELLPGTPLADVLPIATDVLELEITPNRPDCLSIYGVAREVHAATGAPLNPPPWLDDPGTPGAGRGRERSRSRTPDLCPRFTARLFEDVTIGPSPALAEGAPDGRRPAPDQQRRRHHQLRDAAHRPAAARVRLGPRRGRAPRRPPRAATARR